MMRDSAKRANWRNHWRRMGWLRDWREGCGIEPGAYPRKPANAAKLKRPAPSLPIIPALVVALMERAGMFEKPKQGPEGVLRTYGVAAE